MYYLNKKNANGKTLALLLLPGGEGGGPISPSPQNNTQEPDQKTGLSFSFHIGSASLQERIQRCFFTLLPRIKTKGAFLIFENLARFSSPPCIGGRNSEGLLKETGDEAQS